MLCPFHGIPGALCRLRLGLSARLRTCDAPTCGEAGGASEPAGSEASAAGNPAPQRCAATVPSGRLEPVRSIRFKAPAVSAKRVVGETAKCSGNNSRSNLIARTLRAFGLVPGVDMKEAGRIP